MFAEAHYLMSSLFHPKADKTLIRLSNPMDYVGIQRIKLYYIELLSIKYGISLSWGALHQSKIFCCKKKKVQSTSIATRVSPNLFYKTDFEYSKSCQDPLPAH